MRASFVGVLGLAWVAGALGCADTHSLCGPAGTFVADGDTQHCVYALALPIVIEGGFECPSEMPFELDLNAHRVCSTRPFDSQDLSPSLCAKMPELCSASEAPPALPKPPLATMPAGRLDAGGPAGDSRAPVTWTDCNSRTQDEGMTGDRCDPAIGGCATCAPGMKGCGSDTCSVKSAVCGLDGILKVSATDVLECADSVASVPEHARVYRGAEDCEAALTEGHSFQTCEGSFVCARRTEEPCCIEYALCNNDSPMPTHHVVRYLFCERGCTNIEPDEQRAPISDCGAFADEQNRPQDDFWRADLSCEGDFVCWDDQDLSDGRGVDADDLLTGRFRWCSQGVVRGQHSTNVPAFFPIGPFSI